MNSLKLKRVIEAHWLQRLADQLGLKFWERFLLFRHDFSTQDKMQRVFRRGIDPYQYASSPYERDRIKRMEIILASRRYKSGLEVGCAEGQMTLMLSSACASLTSVDLSAEALIRAQKTATSAHIKWVRGNIRTWRPERTFDLIALTDVLYYLGDPTKGLIFEKAFENFLKRLIAWLNPGGHVLLANAFGNERERRIREDYALRFERLGLKTLKAETAGEPPHDKGNVRCLIHLLEKPCLEVR
ncbi:MAG: methyltransferase domain-containing protein [Elusimicrobia bacterium]|nr:methyltransferase domain-containing protein [Elusimicrobiota bacterium]